MKRNCQMVFLPYIKAFQSPSPIPLSPPQFRFGSNGVAVSIVQSFLPTAVINLHILRINNLCDMGIVCYEPFY